MLACRAHCNVVNDTIAVDVSMQLVLRQVQLAQCATCGTTSNSRQAMNHQSATAGFSM